MRWIVSVPAWGPFARFFIQKALPSLRRGSFGMTDVCVLVHTDDPALFERLDRPALRIETRAFLPTGQWFETMSTAHRWAIAEAASGDVVVLLTADMVVSDYAFAACARAFAQGRKIVACNAGRAVAEYFDPMLRRTGRELSEWAWDYRHPIMEGSVWPGGRDDDLPRVYFHNGPKASVVCRTWMPHPLAVLIDDRKLEFNPTIDADLIACFRPEEIHLVTSPDDLAACELSPLEKTAPSRDANEPPARSDLPPLCERYAEERKHFPNRAIRPWLLSHRITVAGTGEGCGDDEAVAPLLSS